MSQRINRRYLIKGIVATGAALGTTLAATSASAKSDGHSGHKHHSKNPYEDLIESAMTCSKDGQACLDHCFVLLKDGDSEIAQCAEIVTEMLVMVDALAKMASYRSSRLKEFAKVCAAVCKDCQDECEKHADKHAECKVCAESCEDCIKACDKIL